MATDKIQTGIRFHEEMLKKITYIAKKEPPFPQRPARASDAGVH